MASWAHLAARSGTIYPSGTLVQCSAKRSITRRPTLCQVRIFHVDFLILLFAKHRTPRTDWQGPATQAGSGPPRPPGRHRVSPGPPNECLRRRASTAAVRGSRFGPLDRSWTGPGSETAPADGGGRCTTPQAFILLLSGALGLADAIAACSDAPGRATWLQNASVLTKK